jgi:hypothetical protein
MAQIEANLDIDLTAPSASADLALMVSLVNSLSLGGLSVPCIPGLPSLSALFSVIASVEFSLGVDLLAPGAAASLQAALSASATASASAEASASAALSASPTAMMANLSAALGRLAATAASARWQLH